MTGHRIGFPTVMDTAQQRELAEILAQHVPESILAAAWRIRMERDARPASDQFNKGHLK